jgi:hypothetical protein
MPQESPWHSIKERVYHNNTDCKAANNIDIEYLRPGTGGRPLCPECAQLNRPHVDPNAIA